MFTRAFSRMLAASADGGPALPARPIIWSAGLIGQHAVAANTVFGCVQLLIGLGIAWRRSLRLALGASVLWAAAVWWLGEGYGGMLSGTAGPVSGAPGAVLLYALAAVLLWPAARDRPAPFVAGRAVGAGAARATLVLAVLLAAFIWLAQGLGGLFSGSATDPDSGPLLALLAVAYWPTAGPARSRQGKEIPR